MTIESKNDSHGWKTVGEPKSRNARPARRKVFATRIMAKLLGDPAKDEANISVALTSILTHCKCNAPVNLQVI